MKIPIVVLLCGLLVGCLSYDAQPVSSTAAFLAQKEITTLEDGTKQILMGGDILRNPLIAVEAFHRLADREFGRTPYDFAFVIGELMQTVDIPKAALESNDPSLTGPTSLIGLSRNIRNRNQAIIDTLNKESDALEAGATKEEVTETVVVDDTLVVYGLAKATSPLRIDRSRPLEIIHPGEPVLGAFETGDMAYFLEVVREKFSGYSNNAMVVPNSNRNGYVVEMSILRWQRVSLQGYTTVGFEIKDRKTDEYVCAFLVIAEPQLVQKGMSSSLRANPADTLRRPLTKYLERYLL
ncbi:MAG: hypothetical protein AAGJ79_03620 [Verrucomicrobiota bacterium]